MRALALTLLLILPMSVRAEPMKEFVTACTYGVLAGTLVGAATLAFTDKPGENLNNIARGASFGLYGGILLGAYVAYVVPGSGSSDEEYDEEDSSGESAPSDEGGATSDEGDEGAFLPSLRPLISQNGIDGAALNFHFRF